MPTIERVRVAGPMSSGASAPFFKRIIDHSFY